MIDPSHNKTWSYLVNVHVSVGLLKSLGGFAHGLEDGRVGVGALEGLALLLDGGQGAVDLLELAVVSLLPFQGLQNLSLNES